MRTLILLSIILTSCSLSRRTESNENTIQNNDKNEIVFLVLKISEDSIQGKNVIEFVSKTKTAGTIKDYRQDHNDYGNYLTIDVYEQNKLINTIIIEHPLYKRVEYFDGNVLTSKSIELAEQDFFIRMQMTGKSTKIRIYETLKNTIKKEMTTIQL